MAIKSPRAFKGLLDRLEEAYGPLVESDDPVEMAVMTVLARRAPHLSTEVSRTRLRDAFVDWNEFRVADPWDVVYALGAQGDKSARTFAKAARRLMRSLHSKLNRCGFDRVRKDPEADVPTMVGQMRGVPVEARATLLSVLDGGWHPTAEVGKCLHQLGFAPKTTSRAKIVKAMEAACRPQDRLRAQYLLSRYAHRGPNDPNPLGRRSAPAKKAATKATSTTKAASSKKAPSAKKPATKKPVTKKPVTKKPAVKKTVKKVSAKKPSPKQATAEKPLAKKKTASKKPTKKPGVKKPTAKKTTAKKPAAKKATAKKK